MESIMQLLEELEGYLHECNTLPFSTKVVVNMEVIYEFMADIRMKLPEEIKRSRRIIEEKDQILEEAKATAKAIDIETKAHVEKMLDEHEIRRRALADADSLLKKAKNTAQEITDGAYNYVEELLAQNQQVLKDLLIKSNQQFAQYDAYLKKQIEVIEQNRASISK
jgi:cell division septum initiation protein DivIVA